MVLSKETGCHGLAPWHLETSVLILISSKHEAPRGKPVASLGLFVQSPSLQRSLLFRRQSYVIARLEFVG
jgi:hypothetical protein